MKHCVDSTSIMFFILLNKSNGIFVSYIIFTPGWALDSVICQNLVTRFSKDDIHDSPPEGVYVHGFFLEGAALDRKTGKLLEARSKVLYEQMPVIYIYAINSTAGILAKSF